MNKPELFSVENEAPAAVPYHYRECGLDNIFLLNGFNREEYDGDTYVSVHNVDDLWKEIAFNIVLNNKIMSPKEIKFLRAQMRLTQSELSTKLRVDDQTVARWEKGKVKLPGPADLAIRMTFLSSPMAQPEGSEILKDWCKLVSELVGKDQVEVEKLVFERANGAWIETEPRRHLAAC